MFLDEATITVHGGKGGDGIVSWRKEKYVSRGGPWGGDGGKGGDVIIRAHQNTDTLSLYSERKVFSAANGNNGGKANCRGKCGEDLVLHVPPGTIIINTETKEILADLSGNDDEFCAASGGRGGYGNAHFKSSTRQAPDFAELGEPGKTKSLFLELKMVAEVGIIGFPSVGKSTLISVISSAKPKIAEYHFTTLIPNLGVVTVHDRSFVVCDVPGLIEGASKGKGLGDKFLRHIERCGVLIHLLDAQSNTLVQDYKTIRKELESYSPTLSKKRELVVLNKCDLVAEEFDEKITELQQSDIKISTTISAATHEGIDELMNVLLHIVLEERQKRIVSQEKKINNVPILQPQLESDRTDAFIVENEKGIIHVKGKRIEQIIAMTDWSNGSAIQRFRDIIERIGLRKALERIGGTENTNVFVGKIDVSKYWK